VKINDLVRGHYNTKVVGIILEVDNHEGEDCILVQFLSGLPARELQHFTPKWYYVTEWVAVPKRGQ